MFISSDLSLERFEEESKNAYVVIFLSKEIWRISNNS